MGRMCVRACDVCVCVCVCACDVCVCVCVCVCCVHVTCVIACRVSDIKFRNIPKPKPATQHVSACKFICMGIVCVGVI